MAGDPRTRCGPSAEARVHWGQPPGGHGEEQLSPEPAAGRTVTRCQALGSQSPLLPDWGTPRRRDLRQLLPPGPQRGQFLPEPRDSSWGGGAAVSVPAGRHCLGLEAQSYCVSALLPRPPSLPPSNAASSPPSLPPTDTRWSCSGRWSFLGDYDTELVPNVPRSISVPCRKEQEGDVKEPCFLEVPWSPRCRSWGGAAPALGTSRTMFESHWRQRIERRQKTRGLLEVGE